jgi:TonB family protein
MFLHVAIIWFAFRTTKKKSTCLPELMIEEVSLYSPQKNRTSGFGVESSQIKITSQQEKSKGKVVIKENVIVKKEESHENKSLPGLKTEIKKIDTPSIKLLKEKKTEYSNCSPNNDSVGENQSSFNNLNLGTSVVVREGNDIGIYFETQNFRSRSSCNLYKNLIYNKILPCWRWSKSRKGFETVICFKIHRDGRVSDICIKESSGNSDYDRIALNAIERVGLFPPSDGYEKVGDFIEVSVKFGE